MITESAVDPIYFNMENYKGENINSILNSVSSFLIYRQFVARRYPFDDDVKELIEQCNKQILEILSIPNL